MKVIGIANGSWQVLSQGLFSGVYIKLWHALLNLFSICSVSLPFTRGQSVSAGRNLGCEPSISDSRLLCTSKSSARTLRSPTLHLRWRIKEIHYALKKLIPEDGRLDVSQCGYDTVMVSARLLFFFCFFFYPFVKAILLDLLLRVNNLRPRCWHCADVFFSGCHVTQKRRGCRQ